MLNQVLIKLRAGDSRLVEEEMQEIRQEAEAETEPQMTVLELLRSAKLRVALLICVVMHLSQQLSGMVAIFYYSVTFFKYEFFII